MKNGVWECVTTKRNFGVASQGSFRHSYGNSFVKVWLIRYVITAKKPDKPFSQQSYFFSIES